MILRRLAEGLKTHDWLTVVVETFLVIGGVLIALQVDNWNSARADQSGAISALTRLRSEVDVNAAILTRRLDAIERNIDMRQNGILALQNCDTSEEGEKALSEAISRLVGDITPSFVDNTLLEVSRQDRYLDLLSDDFRNALSRYSASLTDERQQLQINYNLMWDRHVIFEPAVGMDFTSPEKLKSPFIFQKPMKDLCKDINFRRQLLLTESWHQSATIRMHSFKDRTEQFGNAIDTQIAALK